MNNKLKITKEGLFKTLSKTLLAVMGSAMIFTAVVPVQKVQAHDAYFLGITLDTTNLRYMGTVGFDDNDVVANNHKEAQVADFSSGKIKNDSFYLPQPSLGKSTDDNHHKYHEEKANSNDSGPATDVSKGNGDNGMIYTFPAIHDRTTPWDANNVDMDRAYWVSDNLIGSFNDAIGFIIEQTDFKSKYNNSEDKLTRFMELAVNLANKAHEANSGKTTTLTVLGKTFTIKPGTTSPNKDIKKEYCVNISINGQGADYVYKVDKGYMAGQALRNTVPDSNKAENDKTDRNGDITNLTWKHVVLQAHYNEEVKRVSYAQVTDIMKPGKLESMLSEMLSSLVSTLRSLLGLYSLQELMLGQGTRDTSYLYGIMPLQWFKSAQILHWVCQLIAWSLLIGAMVKLLVQRNLASINSAMRVNLMEGIQNILLTGFLLTLVIPIFYALGSMNDKIVDVFGQSSIWIDTFGSTTAGSSGLLGVIVLNIVYFVVMLYFNFVYIMRAITVALLYGTAPLFVVSIAFGGKYKQLFGNWLKELISNIYMQSFHAICLSFFSTVNMSGVRGIEGIVLIYAFVPMTQFFRQSLMGLSGGTAEKLGGKALSAGAGMVAGFAGGAMAGSKAGGATAKAGAGAKTTATTGGIQTKSSDALRTKSGNGATPTTTTKAGKGGSTSTTDAGVGKVSAIGDANDRIPNAELTGFGKMKEGMNKFSQTKTGKVMGTVGKAGAKMAGGAIQASIGAGLAMGGSAVDSQVIAGKGAQHIMKGGGRFGGGVSTVSTPTIGKAKEGISNLNEKMTYKSPKSGNEGYMYANDKGDGTIDYKHEAKGLEKDAGISQMADNGKSLQYELDGEYHKGVGFKFNHGSLNQGEAYDNVNSMVTAFASKDADAIAYYQKQGIQNVGVNERTGKVVVTRTKQNSGYNSVSKSGSNYVINKDNTAKFSNKELYNIPKYVPKPQPTATTTQGQGQKPYTRTGGGNNGGGNNGRGNNSRGNGRGNNGGRKN